MYTILFLYGALQLQRLHGFDETVVTNSMKDSYYSMDDVFPVDIEDMQYDNFQIAFGITAYDGNPESVEDPRYGRMIARYDSWGLGERFVELPVH